ncbi:hypothetical protein pb186bvf_010864 [Paramecium bursaria]
MNSIELDLNISQNVPIKQPINCNICQRDMIQSCSFCTAEVETFEYQSQDPTFFTLVVVDQIWPFDDKRLSNAGIHPHIQEQNNLQINYLLNQNKSPLEIAIQLGCYTQDDINDAITRQLKNTQKQEQEQEYKFLLDLRKLSKKWHNNGLIDQLNTQLQQQRLPNVIILIPSNPPVLLYEDQQVVIENLEQYQSALQKIQKINTNTTPPVPTYFKNEQKFLKIPFVNEIILITNRSKEEQQFFLFDYNCKLQVVCPPNLQKEYRSIARKTGGNIWDLKKLHPEFLKVVVHFSEGANNAETIIQESLDPITVNIQGDGPVFAQIHVWRYNGKQQTHYVQQKLIKDDETIKLTDYSKKAY